MFDFLGRLGADRRPSGGRQRVRGPVTIGFEQLEGREMLASGVALSIIPSEVPPLRFMPRPIVGSFDPGATAEAPAPAIRRPWDDEEGTRTWPRPLGWRFRMG